jgi:ribosome biogenesis GTPase
MSDPERRKGILIRGIGGLYGVRLLPLAPGGELLLCRARGVFRHEKISPLPGDVVTVAENDAVRAAEGALRDATHVIEEILPRRCALTRPPLANLTHLFLAIPAARPSPDLLTADKLLAAAESRRIAPTVVVTKKDLDPDGAERLRRIYEAAGFSAFSVSAEDEASLETLRRFLLSLSDGEETPIAAFTGASGAGKSTLMSRLFPALSLKTGEVSRKIGRGRQTTRHVELYAVEDGGKVCLIADTPGFSLFDLADDSGFDPARLPEAFREFRPYLGRCRYTKCTHTKEEGCAILEAARAGEIPLSRCESYASIFDECRKIPEWKRKQEERNGT